MFSFHLFGDKPAPTRFEQCAELKEIFALLARLRKKEYELDRAKTTNGAGSSDYAKYTVVTALLNDLDNTIAEFNAQPARAQHADEVRDMISLINNLTAYINNALTHHRETLNIFRNTQRETAAKTLNTAVGVVTVATLFTAPLSIIPKLSVICGLSFAGGRLGDYAGVHSRIARSLALLEEFKATLRHAKVNLMLAIGADRNDGALLAANPGFAANGLLYVYSPATKDYVDAIRNKPMQVTDMLDELDLTEDESAQLKLFECPILLSVMDIPVMVGSHEFDLDSLLALPVDDEDQRTHPITRHKFFVRDIQPSLKSYNAILEIIESIKVARLNPDFQQLSPNVRPSAPRLEKL